MYDRCVRKSLTSSCCFDVVLLVLLFVLQRLLRTLAPDDELKQSSELVSGNTLRQIQVDGCRFRGCLRGVLWRRTCARVKGPDDAATAEEMVWGNRISVLRGGLASMLRAVQSIVMYLGA